MQTLPDRLLLSLRCLDVLREGIVDAIRVGEELPVPIDLGVVVVAFLVVSWGKDGLELAELGWDESSADLAFLFDGVVVAKTDVGES